MNIEAAAPLETLKEAQLHYLNPNNTMKKDNQSVNAIKGETQQRTLDWFRVRLGNITGSECGKLMVSGRKKEDVFGETAKSYLYRLAAERTMNPAIIEDDELMEQYVDYTELHTKAIRWGQEQEDNAKELYQTLYGVKLDETGSVSHPTIEHFAASPDAIVLGEDGQPTECVEFKSPGQETFMRYAAEVNDAESLKKANAQYYWQVMAEMMCVGVRRCWFVVFCPWQRVPLKRVLVELTEEAEATLTERVALANATIEKIISTVVNG